MDGATTPADHAEHLVAGSEPADARADRRHHPRHVPPQRERRLPVQRCHPRTRQPVGRVHAHRPYPQQDFSVAGGVAGGVPPSPAPPVRRTGPGSTLVYEGAPCSSGLPPESEPSRRLRRGPPVRKRPAPASSRCTRPAEQMRYGPSRHRLFSTTSVWFKADGGASGVLYCPTALTRTTRPRGEEVARILRMLSVLANKTRGAGRTRDHRTRPHRRLLRRHPVLAAARPGRPWDRHARHRYARSTTVVRPLRVSTKPQVSAVCSTPPSQIVGSPSNCGDRPAILP